MGEGAGATAAPAGRAPLTCDQLRREVAAGEIDTVVVAVTDMQGRLQGKRVAAPFFLTEVARHGCDACTYLLAADVEMTPAAGYAMASWEQGYGDFVIRPDLRTLRRLPWHAGTALVLGDLAWQDGSAVSVSPRQVLRRQLARLAERGWTAMAATELEFIVFRDTYEEAWRRGYRDLTPGTPYNADYSLLGTSPAEPLLRRIRLEMAGAGLTVESAKGECHPGQHEIVFTYADALTTADNHVVYKSGAKEIAAQAGCSLTFMAKFDGREGNSCHIHLSLRDPEDEPVFCDASGAWSTAFEHVLAGQLACLPELTLLLAPNVNSYKRFAGGSFAPTRVAWGRDNRTCALRVVGAGRSLRLEHRVPGGDANPYLALAALLAAGLHGLEQGLPLPPELRGNAYASPGEELPRSLTEAVDRFARSGVAREAFGDDVVDHYTTMGQVELATFGSAVTDWERVRGFERL